MIKSVISVIKEHISIDKIDEYILSQAIESFITECAEKVNDNVRYVDDEQDIYLEGVTDLLKKLIPPSEWDVAVDDSKQI